MSEAARRLFFITHADVQIDPDVPVPEWRLNARGSARHSAFASSETLTHVSCVWSSAERKARDAARITATALGVPHHVLEDLHENDRSATGYLPKAAFEDVADLFFAKPTESVRGWERALDAQTRVVQACKTLSASSPVGDIAVVAHGGVGCLLVCHLKGEQISRRNDQSGGQGGNYVTVALPEWRLEHEWRDIAPNVLSERED